MKKFYQFILIVVFSLWTCVSMAQGLYEYTFSTGTDATKWIPLTTTTPIITPGAVDSRASSVLDIGFNFTFGDDIYTQFSVNTDGNLRLGPTVTGVSAYSSPFNATNANTNSPKINFMGCDGYQTDSCYVYKELVGTAPNRILVVEFAMSTYNNISRPSLLRWQVQLFEGSNDVQIVYASTTPPILPNVTRQVGMCINASDIWMVNASHVATHYTSGQTSTIAVGNWPDPNRYYHFAAPVITCIRPFNLSSPIVSSSSATVSWGTSEPSSNAIVQLKPAYDSWTSPSVFTTQLTDTFYQFTGLTPSTSYDFRVAVDCGGGDTSAWSTASFTTSCVEIDTLPYFCDFETAGSGSYPLPLCWTKGTQHANYPYRNTGTNAYQGNGFLYFYTTNYVALPPIDRDVIDLSTTQVSFYARGNGFVLKVGMMSDPTDLSTFVQIGTDITLNGEYAKYEIPLGTYTGAGSFIVLRNIANNYIYVDNVSLEEIPNCTRPVFLSITDSLTTQNSLQLTWTEAGTATEWEVEYGPAGFLPGNGTVVNTSVPYLDVANLSPASSYDFYVRSFCASGEMSEYSNKCTGTTLCGLITSMPFSENFDSYAGASTSSSTAVLPHCWSNYTTSTSSSYTGYPYIYNSTVSNYALSGINSLYFSSYKTSATTLYGGDEYVILPPIDTTLFPMNSLQLEFSARKRSANSSDQVSYYYFLTLYVGVWAEDNTFTPVDTIEIGTMEDLSYHDYVVMFNKFSGYGNHIAIMAPAPAQSSTSGGSYGVYYYNAGHVDDIMVSVIPSCPKPFEVQAFNELPYSVTVDWTPMGNESEWEVVAVPQGSDPDVGSPMPTLAHPFTYTGLTPSTDYDIYVRAICGNEYSPWSKKQTVTTKCTPTTVPYVENFDTYGTSTSSSSLTPGVFPSCWTALCNNTSPYPYISSTYHSSGVGALYFYSTSTSYAYAASQAIDVSQYPAGSLALSFKIMKTSENYGRMRVGVTTNPNYVDSMIVIKDFYPTDYESVNTWYSQMLILPGHYTEPIYLVFYLPEGGTRYSVLDDVQLMEAPECPAPSLLSVSQVMGSTALLTWNPSPYNVQDYIIQYSEQGMDDWSLPIHTTDNHYILSELSPETFYEVRLFTECEEGSSDTLTATFRTGCLSGVSDLVIGAGTSTTYYVPTYVTTSTTSNYSLNQQLWESSELGSTPGNISSISLRYAGTVDTTRNYNIYMMHTVEPTIPNTFMPMTNAQLVYSGNVRWVAGGDGWNTIVLDTVFHYNGDENVVITFDDNTGIPVGSTSAVKFYYTANGSSTASQNRCHVVYKNQASDLDPFNLGSITGTRSTYRNNIRFGFECDPNASCVAPNVLVTDVTGTSVTLDWVPGYGETTWELQYKTASEVDYTTEGLVTSAPYTVLGLSPSQNYMFRMCAVCSVGDSSAWTTVTAQTPCDFAEFPLTENFDGYPASSVASSGIMPSCWVGLTNYESQKPYVSSVETFSGTGALRLYGTSSYYGIAVLPPFDTSIIMDSLQVQCHVYTSDQGALFEVGMMSDPNDPSTFEIIGSYTPSEVSTWKYVAVNTTSYVGSGRYLALRVPQNSTCALYVDDITVKYIPTCVPVSNIQAVSLTATQAEITWTPGDAEFSWNYFYGPANSVDVTMTDLSEGTTANTVQLTDLSPNTDYVLFVQSDCGADEYSSWMSFAFTTPCLPLQLPYYEDFESYAGVTSYSEEVLPDCWHRINTGTYSYYLGLPVIYGNTSYSQSGMNSLYLYTSQSLSSDYGNLYAILPEIDTAVNPIHTLRLSFGARKYLASYDFILVAGVISDITDQSTFVPVKTISVTGTTYQDVVVDFSSYSGAGRNIALFLDKNITTSTTTNAGYIDDITLEMIPQCDAPTNLVVSDVTQTSATITWSPSGAESSWELYLVNEGGSISTTTPSIVSDTTFSYTDLTEGTVYEAYVRAICPNGVGYSGYQHVVFTTECFPFTELPFEENFDSYTGNAAASTASNNLPSCWHYINNGTNTYSGCPYIYSTSTLAESGLNTLRFYTGTSTGYASQYAILPEIDVQQHPINTLQLQFDVRKNSTSYDYFALVVGVMSSPTDVTTFEPVDTLVIRSIDYINEFVYFNNYQGSGSYIALMAPNQSGVSYNGGYLDNISLSEMPSCQRVRNDLTAFDITTDAITLTWTPTGPETDWIVEYRDQTDDTWLTLNASIIPFTLGNLTPNTTYEIRVKADCGNGNVSEASVPVSVTTECLPMGVPYVENFDSYTDATASSTTNYLPSCWKYINDGSNSTYAGCPSMYSGSTYANSGLVCLRFFTGTASSYGNEFAILPAIDTTEYPIQNLRLSFNAKKSSTTYNNFTLVVGVIADVTDTSTFTPCDTVVIISDTYVPAEVFFRNWTGYGDRIALWAIKNNGVALNQGYVDDIAVSIASTCLPVRDNVEVSGITSSSAVVSWTPNGTETEWLLRYKASDAPNFDTLVVSGAPTYQLTGLNANTLYAVQILASCDNGEYASSWTTIKLFTTSCFDIDSLPYTEGFEGVVGTTNTSEHVLPDCWNYYNTGSSNSGMPQVYNSSSYAQNGTNSLRFYTYASSAYSDQYAVMPGIDSVLYPMNTLQITMGARRNASNYNFMLVVGVMTDPFDISTFTPVDTISASSTAYSNHTVRFETYSGTGKYIALRAPKSSGSSYNEGSIDNIVVEVAPRICDAPTNLTAYSVMQTTASISWTTNGSETEWNLQYKEAAASSWSNSVVVQSTPNHNLTGLTANTAYHVRVQSVCDTDLTSEWSTATFTTLEEVIEPDTCDAPTNLQVVGLTPYTATLTWTQVDDAALSWIVQYRQSGATSWLSVPAPISTITLTGLSDSTTYEARVVANCVSGVASYPSETITFTTLHDGISNYTLSNAVTLYPNPTPDRVTVTAETQYVQSLRVVELYDAFGKRLSTLDPDGNSVVVDLSGYASGVYFIRVSTEKGTVTKRIVKL